MHVCSAVCPAYQCNASKQCVATINLQVVPELQFQASSELSSEPGSLLRLVEMI